MCGIAAIWGAAPTDPIQDMLRRQRHRGPDGQALSALSNGGAVLGHCRLAIIDPEGGAQPLEHAHDGWTLIANGMIYNDRELRRAHPDAAWRTGTDSESILHLIADQGPDAVDRLDGMFAFVMTDGQRLIAARDPVGIKPLYWGRLGHAIAFASEAKVLAAHCDHVTEFPAGSVFDSDRGGLTVGGLTRYYDLPGETATPWREADAIQALRETLEAAVVKRLRSDVPFGALLSGGLDSSIIAALAARHVPDLKTFAIGFSGSSDIQAARRVAAHIGSDHHELILNGDDALGDLPDILYHLESFDGDLVRSAVPCWFVSQFAARHVKVVLTGEGADELFAGYTYYKTITDPDALHAELRGSIGRMHNINLQRVDRMSMAHGLEARVPFLDREMIALGLSLPVAMRLKRDRGRAIEKWILRKSFEDLLPADIVWRDKIQFDEGSGTTDFMRGALAGTPPGGEGRTAEEAHYRAILEQRLDHPRAVLDLVAHWNPEPAARPHAAQ